MASSVINDRSCSDILITPPHGTNYFIFVFCNRSVLRSFHNRLQLSNFQLHHGENKLIINEMIMRSACTRSTRLVGFLYNVSSLKQQFVCNVAPFGHIILIPSQPVFAFSPECYVLSREATNINFIYSIWFDRTWSQPHDLSHSRQAC